MSYLAADAETATHSEIGQSPTSSVFSILYTWPLGIGCRTGSLTGGFMKVQTHAMLGAALFLALVTSSARASILTYDVVLSGSQSVPANVTDATGAATVILDDVLDTVSVDMSFTGLIGGPASAAHIHCCVATDANGPVVIPFTDFPATTSGTYSNTFTGISVADITGIEAGLAYINIHNATFPGGEIRGDILAAVPEPGSLSLLTVAIGALSVLRIRSRKKTSEARRQICC